jgi:hypothetical protein
MSFFDKTIEFFAPETALRRETARKILNAQRAYEVAKPSRLRKPKTDAGSGDAKKFTLAIFCQIFYMKR